MRSCVGASAKPIDGPRENASMAGTAPGIGSSRPCTPYRRWREALELAHETEFGAGAAVIVQLRR